MDGTQHLIFQNNQVAMLQQMPIQTEGIKNREIDQATKVLMINQRYSSSGVAIEVGGGNPSQLTGNAAVCLARHRGEMFKESIIARNNSNSIFTLDLNTFVVVPVIMARLLCSKILIISAITLLN